MGTARVYFNVRNQTISRVDRMRVMSKSHDYLMAHFDFVTNDWDGVSKVAIFSKDGTSYKMTLDPNSEALVPWELLETTGTVEVSVYGGDLITVNSATITVEESAYTDEATNEQPPTPDVWEQLLSKINNIDGGTFEEWGDD